MFLIALTDGASVHFNAFAEIDDVTAIRVHVTRIADHAWQINASVLPFDAVLLFFRHVSEHSTVDRNLSSVALFHYCTRFMAVFI